MPFEHHSGKLLAAAATETGQPSPPPQAVLQQEPPGRDGSTRRLWLTDVVCWGAARLSLRRRSCIIHNHKAVPKPTKAGLTCGHFSFSEKAYFQNAARDAAVAMERIVGAVKLGTR